MSRKHVLLMLACCLIPIAAIVAIGVLAIPLSSVVTSVIALLCPIMTLFMMRGMHGDHTEDHEPPTAPIQPKE